VESTRHGNGNLTYTGVQIGFNDLKLCNRVDVLT